MLAIHHILSYLKDLNYPHHPFVCIRFDCVFFNVVCVSCGSHKEQRTIINILFIIIISDQGQKQRNPITITRRAINHRYDENTSSMDIAAQHNDAGRIHLFHLSLSSLSRSSNSLLLLFPLLDSFTKRLKCGQHRRTIDNNIYK